MRLAADRAFRFWQVLILNQLLKLGGFYWTKWYAGLTAGVAASKRNEYINKAKGDDENCRGRLGYSTSARQHGWMLTNICRGAL